MNPNLRLCLIAVVAVIAMPPQIANSSSSESSSADSGAAFDALQHECFYTRTELEIIDYEVALVFPDTLTVEVDISETGCATEDGMELTLHFDACAPFFDRFECSANPLSDLYAKSTGDTFIIDGPGTHTLVYQNSSGTLNGTYDEPRFWITYGHCEKDDGDTNTYDRGQFATPCPYPDPAQTDTIMLD